MSMDTTEGVEILVNAYKGRWAYVLVDESDAEWARTYKWGLGRDGYAYRQVSLRETAGKRGVKRVMHRELLGLEPGDPRVCDHINRRKWDNRRSNLRVLESQGQNLQNQTNRSDSMYSQTRGVGVWKKGGLMYWRARGQIGGKQVTIGYYKTEEEAVSARLKWAGENMPYSTETAA